MEMAKVNGNDNGKENDIFRKRLESADQDSL